jgi:membrane protein YqaA with SNARE-associated domain
VRAFTQWVLGTFTSSAGILIIAALDSTIFLWLPFGIDAATILLSMRGVMPWWLTAAVVTAGSAAGSFVTFWMGAKAGEAGLERYVSDSALNRARRRIGAGKSTVALAALSLVPPPFPFTPIVLAAGALEVHPATFFTTLVLSRYTRFGIEAYLARRFGPATLDWLNSPVVEDIILGFVLLGAVLTIVSIVRLARSRRRVPARA